MKRLIGAFIALIISIPLIYKGGSLFYIYTILISLIGLREILNLFVSDNITKVLSYLVFLTIIFSNLFKSNFENILDFRIIGIIFLIFTLITMYNYQKKKNNLLECFYLLGMTLFLSISFSIIVIIRNINLIYFIYLLLIAFANDIFSYIIDVFCGKHKINETLSNKTWEGSLGGLILATLIISIFYLIFINSNIFLFKIIIINLFLSILSQFGNLFFSLIKKNYNIKYFSNLMPGHGGVLDRLDSVIFVMLASTFIITLI